MYRQLTAVGRIVSKALDTSSSSLLSLKMFKFLCLLGLVALAYGQAKETTVQLSPPDDGALLSSRATIDNVESKTMSSGDPAVITDYPYTAHLTMLRGVNVIRICAGSIVGDNFILTTAQCVQRVTSILIKVGTSISNEGGKDYVGSSYTVHPNYNDATSDYDVALIKTSLPIEIDLVNTKVVPIINTERVITSGTQVNVTGWGPSKAPASGTTLASRLVPAIGNAECNSNMQDRVTERMFCAGLDDGKKSSCQFGSGNPAVINNVQYGIQSFSDGCKTSGKPVVYSNLSNPVIRKFIKDTITDPSTDNPTTDGGKKVEPTTLTAGDPAVITDYPYTAHLTMRRGTTVLRVCAGSIISNNFILTSAYCVQGIESILIKIGSSSSNAAGRDYVGSSYSTHPNFDQATLDYDVAVIKTSLPMDIDSVNTNVVPLVSSERVITSGTLVNVTGWGPSKSPAGSTLASKLVPAIGNAECNSNMAGRVTQRMICAGLDDGKKPSCQFGSGNPAVINNVQYGIQSFSDGCKTSGKPVVYSNIADSVIRKFIRDTVDGTITGIKIQNS